MLAGGMPKGATFDIQFSPRKAVLFVENFNHRNYTTHALLCQGLLVFPREIGVDDEVCPFGYTNFYSFHRLNDFKARSNTFTTLI